MAGSSAEPLPKLFKGHMELLKRQGLKVPNFDKAKCSLYHARKNKLQGSMTVFKLIVHVEVRVFIYRHNGASFEEYEIANYQYGDTRLFCSNKVKELVDTIKEYFLNATFNSYQKPFTQLLST